MVAVRDAVLVLRFLAIECEERSRMRKKEERDLTERTSDNGIARYEINS